MTKDTLIKVDGVSKKFCRSLKQSLWYGLQDLGNELRGRRHGGNGELRRDEFWAVKDVSFEVKRGECIGLIGRNGAGKSTLLKMLNGLIKPDQGSIQLRGRVAALIELNAGFNPILTGRENIYINGQVIGLTKREIDRKLDAIIAFAEIGDFLDMPVQNYSSGMRVRLGFAVAAQMEPDVLIIDEVLAVGDTGFKVKCLNRIHEMLENSAVIFVTHSMPFVARICTEVMVLNHGQNIYASSDIGEGIDIYNQAFEAPDARASGSGEVEITSVRCNGNPARDQSVITFGGAIELEFLIDVKTDCKVLGMRLQIWNQDLRPVADIVSEDFQSFTWDNLDHHVVVQVVLPELRLAPGRYSVTAYVFKPDPLLTLCRLEGAVSFVVGHHISTGCEIFLPAHYSLACRQANMAIAYGRDQ